MKCTLYLYDQYIYVQLSMRKAIETSHCCCFFYLFSSLHFSSISRSCTVDMTTLFQLYNLKRMNVTVATLSFFICRVFCLDFGNDANFYRFCCYGFVGVFFSSKEVNTKTESKYIKIKEGRKYSCHFNLCKNSSCQSQSILNVLNIVLT